MALGDFIIFGTMTRTIGDIAIPPEYSQNGDENSNYLLQSNPTILLKLFYFPWKYPVL